MIEEREIVIRLTIFEAGALLAKLCDDDIFKGVTEQLISISKDIERNCGVTKELLPDGRLKLTNSNGDVIIRP
ncbi:unnamed protein product, partial [marine sediment metagenome]